MRRSMESNAVSMMKFRSIYQIHGNGYVLELLFSFYQGQILSLKNITIKGMVYHILQEPAVYLILA